AWSARSTTSAASICRCTSRNSSSATTTATTLRFSTLRYDAAETRSLVTVSAIGDRGQQAAGAIGIAIGTLVHADGGILPREAFADLNPDQLVCFVEVA